MSSTTRYKDSLTNKAYGARSQTPVTNLAVQGPNGYLHDMAFYPSMTDFIKPNVIAKVIQAPTALALMPNGAAYVAAYKMLIETWMQGWGGLNRTLNVSAQDTQIGNSGEVFSTPGRVSRARSQVSSTIVEKYGKPVIRFLEDMVRYTIGDPDVIHPLLAGISNDFSDHLADMYGGTILFYEPDRLWKTPQNAYLITNFWPRDDIGENTSQKVLQGDGETVTYNLTWTGYQKVGYAVDLLAKGFMDAARVGNIDPQYQPNFVKAVDSNVASIQTGFHEQINQLKRTQISP